FSCLPWAINDLLVFLVEGGVEGDGALGEVDVFAEGARFGGAVLTVHADVLPLDGERAVVADVVESDDDLLEVDVAAADGAEVPVAAGVAEAGVAAEDADVTVAVTPPDVLHVDVEDAVAELADELHVVDALIPEVGGV